MEHFSPTVPQLAFGRVHVVDFPPPTPVAKPWRCPHGLTSGATCDGCGRVVWRG